MDTDCTDFFEQKGTKREGWGWMRRARDSGSGFAPGWEVDNFF